MKTLLYTLTLAVGLMLASCSTKKSENEAEADSPAIDREAYEPMPITKDTIDVITDTINKAAPNKDTLRPAP